MYVCMCVYVCMYQPLVVKLIEDHINEVNEYHCTVCTGKMGHLADDVAAAKSQTNTIDVCVMCVCNV